MRTLTGLAAALAACLGAGCASHEIPTDPIAHHITIFSEPAGATVHFDPGIVPEGPSRAMPPTATASTGPYHDTMPTVVTPIECFDIPHHPRDAGGGPAHFIVVEKAGFAPAIVELTPESVDGLDGEYVYDHVFLRLKLERQAAGRGATASR
jgi:hypothetical protein